MSYILDALRKSEKERALANIPTLRSADHVERKEISLSWIVVASVLATFIAVSFGLWLSGTPPQPIPVAQEELKEDQAAGVPVQTEQVTKTQSQTVSIVSEDQAVELSDHVVVPVSISDLDPAIRNRLPELSVNALSYSVNEAKRFVMINQNIFKEGEDLGNGIFVEEIKKSTVVLRFEDHLFFLQPF